MTQPQQGGWHPPDRPAMPPGHGYQAPPPGPGYQAPPPGYGYPVPIQPVVVFPAVMQPVPPQPPRQAPMPPRGQWPMQQPPRQVAPPVPVVDPPKSSEEGSIAERLPLPQLPVAPGPSSKAPVLETAKRIPGDLPFVLSPRKGRAWLLFVFSLLVLVAPAAGVAATGRLPLAMLVLVISLAIYIVAFGFRGFAHLGGGPLLAADRHGVWVRSQKVPARAVHLPWELVAEIRAKRWFLEQALCVVPRDDRVGRLRGVWGALDQARTSAFFGVPLTASTAFGDKSRDEALRALDELALGRAKIVGAPART